MTKDNESGEEDNAQEAAGQQDAAGKSGDPSSNNDSDDFKSLRNVVKDVKGENTEIKGQNAMLQSEVNELRSIVSEMQNDKPKDEPFAGRDETDYITIAEQKAGDKALRADLDKEKVEIRREMKVEAFLDSHSDYKETMNKYGKLLPERLRLFLAKYPKDPDVMGAAYEACKNSPAYTKETMSTATHDNVKRIAENMNKPGAGSSTGSGGAISLANKLKNMTPDERVEFSDKCIREG